ncbi:hypothetical protein [Dactylosporangium sp. NPDC051541]|uniref:hypothetical protein n=1 Tax=Dactylosporangium sp. NPDC051541 TaxID=3363977 RepID=UPI00379E7C55
MVDVALLLGGPSEERGSSLDSARSVADHLEGGVVHLTEIIYFDRRLRAYSIPRGLLYCNTPADLDAKLAHEGSPLTGDELTARLRAAGLIFPVIPGEFGADGQIQTLLERADVPFVGSGAQACATAFDKYQTGLDKYQTGLDEYQTGLDKYQRKTARDSVEVTTIVLEGEDGPVALIPTGMSDDDTIAHLQKAVEAEFTALGLRDFARIDIRLQSDGSVLIADVQPITALDQHSPLFRQAARLGLTHADVLREILRSAARRHGLPFRLQYDQPTRRGAPVAILCDGQASVPSGTNVWLKLRRSYKYAPELYFLSPDDSVWQLSYSSALRDSAEQFEHACREAQRLETHRRRLADQTIARLRLPAEALGADVTPPLQLTMDEFLDRHDLVFIARPDDEGDNTTLQALFDKHEIRYNTSAPDADPAEDSPLPPVPPRIRFERILDLATHA